MTAPNATEEWNHGNICLWSPEVQKCAGNVGKRSDGFLRNETDSCPITPRFHSQSFTREECKCVSAEVLFENVHGNLSQCSRNLETRQVPINRRTDKQPVGSSFNGAALSGRSTKPQSRNNGMNLRDEKSSHDGLHRA